MLLYKVDEKNPASGELYGRGKSEIFSGIYLGELVGYIGDLAAY